MIDLARSGATLVACMLAVSPANAQSATMLAPSMTIYPGEAIRDAMIRDVEAREDDPVEALHARADVVGKIARRTLLVGRPILRDMLDEPRAIANGGAVQIVYVEPGLTITASGQALQAARIGDAIRVRNVDSGLVINGIVAADGSVRVSR